MSKETIGYRQAEHNKSAELTDIKMVRLDLNDQFISQLHPDFTPEEIEILDFASRKNNY